MNTLRRPAPVVAASLLALALWAPATLCAQGAAVPEPTSGLASDLEKEVRDMALTSARGGIPAPNAAAAPGAPRVEVSIGQLDPRLRLAPCQHVEPYLPDGMRMWGKSRIGLRCTQGVTKWNVYMPITVKVFGPALVATHDAATGSVLAAADLATAEVDLAEDASAPVANAELAVGRTLTRALKPGQSVRASHLKARQWFTAGETVTVLAQGDGFSVAGEAQALNNGIEGQPVRVRTDSGRVLMGVPTGERRVELGL